MINIYDGAMTGFPAISGNQIYPVLKAILIDGIGKRVADSADKNLLTFNAGYVINKDSHYSLDIDGEIIDVKCKNHEGNNQVLVDTDRDLSLANSIEISLRQPKGWEYSVDANGYRSFKNKNGATFVNNNSQWYCSKDGKSGSWQNTKPANGNNYIILANDDMFIIGMRDSSYGMLYTFYMSDERFALVTDVNSSGHTAAQRSFILDGVHYTNEIKTPMGSSSYGIFGDNDLIAYISDCYLFGNKYYKIPYLKQIINPIGRDNPGLTYKYVNITIPGYEFVAVTDSGSSGFIPFLTRIDNGEDN